MQKALCISVQKVPCEIDMAKCDYVKTEWAVVSCVVSERVSIPTRTKETM